MNIDKYRNYLTRLIRRDRTYIQVPSYLTVYTFMSVDPSLTLTYEAMPLLILTPMSKLPVTRRPSIYGLNLAMIPNHNLRLKVIEEYIEALESEDDARIYQLLFDLRRRSYTKGAYKYYNRSLIKPNSYVELDPKDLREILTRTK